MTLTSSRGKTDRHRRRTRQRVLALAGAGTLLGAVFPAALSAPAASAGEEASCELVRLTSPAGSPWGTVTDIEVVQGKATYYGSFDRKGKDGEWHQRAVVWRGLDAKPQAVGPRGTDATVAFELTPSGLVNGWSENWEKETTRFWVQDLTTGELRWFGTRLDGHPAKDAYIRRINATGAAVGEIRQRGDRHGTAVGYRRGSSTPFQLPVPRRAMGSGGFGINDLGQRSGFWAKATEDPDIGLFQPTVWDGDGRHTLESPGLDADARMINNAGQVSGMTWIGPFDGGHLEAVFWESFDEATALGLLPDGGETALFGMDQGGRVVGWGDHLGDPEHPMADPRTGTLWHNFFWTPEMGEGRAQVLPSLYSVETGETDWREWHAMHAAHATNSSLDQIGAGTHAGFAEDDAPIGAPTVFVNASQCGVEVETSHEAFWEQQGAPSRRSVPRSGGRELMGTGAEEALQSR